MARVETRTASAFFALVDLFNFSVLGVLSHGRRSQARNASGMREENLARNKEHKDAWRTASKNSNGFLTFPQQLNESTRSTTCPDADTDTERASSRCSRICFCFFPLFESPC